MACSSPSRIRRKASSSVEGGPVAVADRTVGGPRKRLSLLTPQDKLVLAAMLGIPTAVHVFLVWLPTVGSIVLSFTRWNGIGGLSAIEPIGLKNYTDIFTIYPPFWPSLAHNLIWLVVLGGIATPFGIFLAVLLDREIKVSRFYQSAFFLPVVMSF